MGQMFRITTMEKITPSAAVCSTRTAVTLNGQKMPLQDLPRCLVWKRLRCRTARHRKASRNGMTPLLSRMTPPRSRNLSVQETASARRLPHFRVTSRGA